MIPPLSPYRLGKAREVFNVFNIFNALSWNLLVGSIVTLLAIRLGASSTYIGLLSALLYMALFFLPLGKVLARRFRVINVFSAAWILRALGMIPVVLAPIAAYFGYKNTALVMTLLGVGTFHVVRGVGMIGNNPVLSNLAVGPDRGSYMTQVQIINSATGMVSGFAIAMILGKDPPLFLYSIIMALGVVCGITSGFIIRKVPEPPTNEGAEKISFAGILREAFSDKTIKFFLIILMLVVLVSGVSRTFLVVYAREVFAQDDGMVLLYSVFGGLGHLLIGLLIKFLVDRIGAKPLFILSVIAGLVTMIPIVLFPVTAIGNATVVILFLAFLFFMLNFGFLGSEGIVQTYFMALVPPAKMLDMGILYFFVFGIAGAGGSFIAGIVLDGFAAMGLSSFAAFKILYGAIIVITIIAIILQQKLRPLGALSFAGAVKIMFSYRDLQAISLLDRLNKTQDSQTEKMLLEELYNKPSRLATSGLLERARSPRLVTRLESIRALEHLEGLTEDAEAALIYDIINNPFTTAYISARILGNQNCYSAIPLLRELVSSGDYMLAGESVIALAKLQDTAFRRQIEHIILDTQNPRLKIMGAESLGIYGAPDSLYTLLDMLRVADPPPYLRDEVVLAMSAIIGTPQQFYRILVRYISEPSLAPALAMDEAESAHEFCKSSISGRRNGKNRNEINLLAKKAASIESAISSLVHGKGGPSSKKGEPLSRWILELPDFSLPEFPAFETARTIFAESLLDDELISHERLYLLIAHWAAYQIRIWSKKIKF